MAVSVDTVYQRVLTLANKEQRGYITPQEFNLFANQAQMEIFEQYFADIAILEKESGSTQEFSDLLNVLYEKIGYFERQETVQWTILNFPELLKAADPDNSPYLGLISPSKYLMVPPEIYKLGNVMVGGDYSKEFENYYSWGKYRAELLSVKDFEAAMLHKLTAPTMRRPIYCMLKNTYLDLYYTPNGTSDPEIIEEYHRNKMLISVGVGKNHYANPIDHGISVNFIQRPIKIEWAYVVVNDKALYNDSISMDFELHPSEETELVYKILKLAGINLKAAEIVQVGQALEQTNKQTTL